MSDDDNQIMILTAISEVRKELKNSDKSDDWSDTASIYGRLAGLYACLDIDLLIKELKK